MGGRKNEALIIGYHPREENGRINLEEVKFINCVPLNDQGQLLDRLTAVMPEKP
jgi:hypothetical protein